METFNIPVFLRRFQPKGGMCTTCAKLDQDCSELDFAQMPVIKVTQEEGGVSIVRCTEHARAELAAGSDS